MVLHLRCVALRCVTMHVVGGCEKAEKIRRPSISRGSVKNYRSLADNNRISQIFR